MQHQITALKAAEIQEVQYRKPGPVQPTLILTLATDSTTDKSRKRRSSRVSGLSKDPYSNSLLFRTIPDEHYSIYDWHIALQPLIKSKDEFEFPLSPISPIATSFINPFSPRLQPAVQSSTKRPDLHHRHSSNTYSSLQSAFDRSTTHASDIVSSSPSLRSRRSDLSSQASSMNRPVGYHSSFPIQHPPPDLPSPASTAGYENDLISGWTSAQGRSSALSTHTRGSNSISVASTPPAPRETILDRAFTMRIIPGGDRVEDDGKELSSIARFEALMRETDKRTHKGKWSSITASKRPTTERGWDPGESSEVEAERPRARRHSIGIPEEDEDDSEYDDDVDPLVLSLHEMPTPAQRALEYISGRITPLPHRPRPPPVPPVPNIDSSQYGQGRKVRPVSLALPQAASNVETDARPSTSASPKRRSSTSTKRLSFTEFTRRLSSTSSLLLVQTNASSGSSASRHSRASSEVSFGIEDDVPGGLNKGLSQSRLSGMSSNTVLRGGAGNEREMQSERRCSWRRSSLGVFGAEGSFL